MAWYKLFHQHIWNLIPFDSSTLLSQVLILFLNGLSHVVQRWLHAYLGLYYTRSATTEERRYHFQLVAIKVPAITFNALVLATCTSWEWDLRVYLNRWFQEWRRWNERKQIFQRNKRKNVGCIKDKAIASIHGTYHNLVQWLVCLFHLTQTKHVIFVYLFITSLCKHIFDWALMHDSLPFIKSRAVWNAINTKFNLEFLQVLTPLVWVLLQA